MANSEPAYTILDPRSREPEVDFIGLNPRLDTLDGKKVLVVNLHGGDVRVVHLPEIGINGNTHFPFSDLNNVGIADLMSDWLKEKDLDK